MSDTKAEAITQLSSLLEGGFNPKTIDETHDTLRLLGMVLAQTALLEMVTDKKSDPKARVSAARALLMTKESPEAIAERLRRSLFRDLTVEQLESMIMQVKEGKTDIHSALSHLRETNNGKETVLD